MNLHKDGGEESTIWHNSLSQDIFNFFSTRDPVSPKKFLCDPRYIKQVYKSNILW